MSSLDERICVYVNGLSGSVREDLVSLIKDNVKWSRVKIFSPRDMQEGADNIAEILEGGARTTAIIGGDGTVSAVYTMMRQIQERTTNNYNLPSFALLRGGTGNGLHHALAVPKGIISPLVKLTQNEGQQFSLTTLPMLEITANDSQGATRRAFYTFAGAGVDARILHDYTAFRQAKPKGNRLLAYLTTIFTTTLSREKSMVQPPVQITSSANIRHVEYGCNGIINEQDYDCEGNVLRFFQEKECHPLSVIMGTSSYYGFGFKAFPLAGYAAKQGKMSLRIVTASAAQLAAHAIQHPMQAWQGIYSQGVCDLVMEDAILTYPPDQPQDVHVAGTYLTPTTQVRCRVNGSIDLVDYAKM